MFGSRRCILFGKSKSRGIKVGFGSPSAIGTSFEKKMGLARRSMTMRDLSTSSEFIFVQLRHMLMRFSPYDGDLSLEFPKANSRVRGGILADSMGMGKTWYVP